MDDPTLEHRVRSLERAARRLRLTCVALAIGIVVSVAARGRLFDREVSAQRFILKDPSGRTRAEWGPTDFIAGTIDGETQHASGTCLRFWGQKPSALTLCAPWEPYGGPSLSMREEHGAKLDISLDAYTISILARATDDRTSDRGKLALGAWMDGAALNVTDKAGRRAQLRGDGLFAFDAGRAVVYQAPGTSAARR
jgi:hypothetical protein